MSGMLSSDRRKPVGLQLVGRLRDRRGQVLVAALRDHDVVLDADADAAEARIGLLVVLRDVEARLDREDLPRLEPARLAVDAVAADVVHVEAEPVAGRVHVVGAVGLARDQLARVALQQAEREQALDEPAHG